MNRLVLSKVWWRAVLGGSAIALSSYVGWRWCLARDPKQIVLASGGRIVGTEHLSIDFKRTPHSIALPLHVLSRLECVYALDLSEKQVTDSDLAKVSALVELRQLSLSMTPIYGSTLGALASCTHLEKLELIGCPNLESKNLQELKQCRHLTEVWLTSTNADDTTLAALSKCSRLKLICVGDTRISQHGCVHLEYLKQLHTLSAYGTEIGDDSMLSLARIPSLQVLDLQSTRITDVGAAYLSQSTSLTMLNLAATGISDVAADDIRKCAQLREVIVAQTAITENGLDRLAKSGTIRRIVVGSPLAESDTAKRLRIQGLEIE